MKNLLITSLLLLLAVPAFATTVSYDDIDLFLAKVETPFLFEDFEQYDYGKFVSPSLLLEDEGNNYIVVLSASTKLYSGDGNMSTKCVNDTLVMDFSQSPTPITAVGGNFWPTDIKGNDLEGYTRLVLSDGTVIDSASADIDDFLGFTASAGSAFTRLELTVAGSLALPKSWPTVDNLYVGTAIPNPEPSSLLLLATGICGIGIVIRRKRT
jgi:hypothetical protein